MKFMPDPSVSHDRQRTNHKNNRAEADSVCHVAPMGDCSVQSDLHSSTRSSDSVSCWGDVPRRPTRLSDLINETSMQDLPSPISVPSRNHVEPRSLPDSTNSANLSTRSETKSTKKTGAPGRERLLEWLRASQAKRDENNRQVFTRWIDKLETMKQQSTVSANLNTSMTCPIIDGTNTTDFQPNGLYPFGSILNPGSLSPPAWWIGNPVGLPLGATGSTFKVPNPLQSNYLMSHFTTKPVPDNSPFPHHPFTLPVTTAVANTCPNSSTETDRLHPDPDFLTSSCLTPQRSCSQEDQGIDEPNSSPGTSTNEEANLFKSGLSNDLNTQNPKLSTGCGYMVNPFPSADLSPCNGPFLPPHMGLTPSSLYDSTCPPVVYYCYIPSPQSGLQAPLTYGFPPYPRVPAMTHQPIVYMPHGSQSPVYPTTAQYSATEANFESSTPTGTEQSDRSSTSTFDQTNERLVTDDDSCGTRNTGVPGETKRSMNQSSVGVGRTDVIGDAPLLTRTPTTFDFDLQKWYAVLSEAASVATEQ